MEIYNGHDTRSKGTLLEALIQNKDNSTLYVNDHYYALNNGVELAFYYNPSYFWAKIPLDKVDKTVLEYLTTHCAVFQNFDPNAPSRILPFSNWTPCSAFFAEAPQIGNLYYRHGHRILSHRKKVHFLGDFGEVDCLRRDITKLNKEAVATMISFSVKTRTPNYIWSINQLDCFKGADKIVNTSKTIIGAIAGDVIGSTYERNNVKTLDFEIFPSASRYTDDSVLTMAVTDAILHKKDFSKTMWLYGRTYRNRGYGGNFRKWLSDNTRQPYDSYGNGSAMRVSAVGFAFDDLDTVLDEAKKTAEVSHNHPEGIKGAQAVASAILLARKGRSKEEINSYISNTFKYNLDFTIDSIRSSYQFDVSCQGSVPQAIVSFLESTDFENAIRLAISIGGDSDTIACIAGGIAAAYYQDIPADIINFVIEKLPNEFIDTLNRFDETITPFI